MFWLVHQAVCTKLIAYHSLETNVVAARYMAKAEGLKRRATTPSANRLQLQRLVVATAVLLDS